MNDSTLLNELEQKIVGLVNALKAERDKNEKNSGSVIESQKLSKIEEHVTNMIKILESFWDSITLPLFFSFLSRSAFKAFTSPTIFCSNSFNNAETFILVI